jgi:hypothetical protein
MRKLRAGGHHCVCIPSSEPTLFCDPSLIWPDFWRALIFLSDPFFLILEATRQIPRQTEKIQWRTGFLRARFKKEYSPSDLKISIFASSRLAWASRPWATVCSFQKKSISEFLFDDSSEFWARRSECQKLSGPRMSRSTTAGFPRKWVEVDLLGYRSKEKSI